jgi:hypothetical protein
MESVGEVRNRKFRQLMKDAGLEKVILCKEKREGYFYITSDDDDMWKTKYNLPETMIYANSFEQMSPEEWVDEIKKLFER